MRKALVAAISAVLIFGGVSVAQAEKPAEPGKEHGQCTAFFNGEKEGHEKQKEKTGEYPGPFEALLDGAPDGADDNDTGGDVADLYEWCQQFGIGGNSEGRWDCVITEDDPATTDDESDTTCTENG